MAPPITYTNPDARVPLGQRRRVAAKTANYTITAEESGTHFTTEGATGAITFTLPNAASGLWYTIFNAEDQDLIVAAPDEGLIAMNDTTADNIAFNTTDEKVGGGILVVSDGSLWHAMPHLGTDAQTPTIGSA